ncbi:MAG: cell division protein FtsZ [Clostridiales Family XIII bacterium]|jgi:cell division protein FtsZ|nr:cell division protein FtsZ [Clostridiales Family XIII bacterium]
MFQEGMLKFETNELTFAKIVVVGIGGGGGNAVNTMISAGLTGVEYVVINTDKQDLSNSNADTKLQIGEKVTGGLGAGGNPSQGQASAEENLDQIESALKGADMVFIAAGMGGGTGTGAAPVVAKISKELGILTVGIVTKPFSFEGRKRKDNADLGINYLSKYVDSLVVVPNDKLLLISDESTTIEEALIRSNDILKHGVQAITEIITKPGFINVDFADVKSVMSSRGIAHIGIGVGSGDNRVEEAVRGAIGSPLLETSIEGAKAVLLKISGGYKLGMLDTQRAADQIEQSADRDAIVIFGVSITEDLGDTIEVTVIATGFEEGPGEDLRPLTGESSIQGSADAQSNNFGLSNDTITLVYDDDLDGSRFGFESDGEPQQESLDIDDDTDGGGKNDFKVPDFLKKN